MVRLLQILWMALLAVTAALILSPVHAQDNQVLKLAFTGERGSRLRAYMMNADGSDITLFPGNDGDNYGPSCSPEGGYVAFIANRTLYVADANLSTVQRVVQGAAYLGGYSLSANAEKVAFVRLGELGNYDIYTSDTNGTNILRVTSESYTDVEPALSPDASRIVFVSNRRLPQNEQDIYIMNSDGSDVTRLTHGGFNAHPRWSPDGRTIIYTAESNDGLNIFTMNPDGTGKTALTNYADSAVGYPAWSPDGGQIAFASDHDGQDGLGIYVMDADGSNVTAVTDGAYYDAMPCWLLVDAHTTPFPGVALSTSMP